MVNGEVLISFQNLVHDSGMAGHSGVICIHCCHTDDRGPCGEKVFMYLLMTVTFTPFPGGSRWGSTVPTGQVEGIKVALCWGEGRLS